MAQATSNKQSEVRRRIAICQAVVWAACNSLEEYGDPITAEGLVYSFDELRELLEPPIKSKL